MKHLRLLSPFVALLCLAGASWALYRELQNYHWHEFVASLQEISTEKLLLAVLFAVADNTILVGNDWIASRHLGRRVPLGQLVMGSVTGYAASHNLGAAFGGAPVRYRFYTSWAASTTEVAAWIALLTISFALGALTIGGLCCLLHPGAVPSVLRLPLVGLRLLGAAMVAVAGSYVAACSRSGTSSTLPSAKLGAAQVGVGSADLCCAAGILFVLLPSGSTLDFSNFLAVYLLALVAGVSSHVPGGLGVFDLVMLKLIVHGDPHDLLAALLVYRGIYYLLPLAVGLVFFGIHELRMRKRDDRDIPRQKLP